MRLKNTWQEIRDHSFIQNLSRSFRFTAPWRCFFSSVHLTSTGFRSEDWNGHSRSLVLCSVTHFCVDFEVCVWIIVRLEDPNMAHYMWLFLTESVTCWFFICWYLIESWCHISKQDVQDLQQKYRPTTYKYISLYTWVLFIPVFTKPILSVCC